MTLEEVFGLKRQSWELCVSLILPFFKKGAEQKENEALVRQALREVKEKLGDGAESGTLMQKLERLADTIDFAHPSEGIGLLVSASVQKLFYFENPVRRNILVGDTFDLRSLIADANHSIPVSVLMLSENEARLYLGTGHKLMEIDDQNFPKNLRNDREYPGSSPASSLNPAQRSSVDKSHVREQRLSAFFRLIDKNLSIYVDSHPLILMGVKEHLGLFSGLTSHTQRIIAEIPGNYEKTGLPALAGIAHDRVEDYIGHKITELISNLVEDWGRHMAVRGLNDVWRAAQQGNVRTLLVERDFSVAAYEGKDGQLHLRDSGQGDTFLANVIDDIIEKVLETHGEVFFAENDALDRFGHIAGQLRYPA